MKIVRKGISRVTKADVMRAILHCSYRYQLEDGRVIKAIPVSEVGAALIANGWRNVSRIDCSDLRAIGFEILVARYVAGARPKRFCNVIAFTMVEPYSYDAHLYPYWDKLYREHEASIEEHH